MSRRNIEAVYPLSPMQQGMLFHSLYAENSGFYFEQTTCLLTGDLDVDAFKKSWQSALDKFDILRTSFSWKSLDDVAQVVHGQVSLPFEMFDWSQFSKSEQTEKLNDLLREDRKSGFDLSKAPLIRLKLFKLNGTQHRCLISHHHLLLDGWSLPLVLKDVFAAYVSYEKGLEWVTESARPYRDYIAWLQKQDQNAAEKFWKKYLEGFQTATPLVLERQYDQKSKKAPFYQESEIQLSETTSKKLVQIARNYHVTLSTLVQAAWALLLNRYSGQDDLVFGVTVSGRPPELSGVEKMVGLFINTLPLRVSVDQKAVFIDWIQEFQKNLFEIQNFDYTPLFQIQKWSEIPSGLPLFDSIFVFENYPISSAIQKMGHIEYSEIRSYEQTNYPLTIVSGPSEKMVLKISYDIQRFSEMVVLRMLGHVKHILEELVQNQQTRLRDIRILTTAEKTLILDIWNQTEAPFPDDKCIYQIFEDRAKKSSSKIALRMGDDKLTYGELSRRSNQVAHYLLKMGLKKGFVAGIFLPRSFEMFISLFGILKAGGIFLPIDSDNPIERVKQILDDANAEVLVTHQNLILDLESQARPVMMEKIKGALDHENTELPWVDISPMDMAYIIYTSGSTGKPKGALIRHLGFINFAHGHNEFMNINEETRCLQFASFGFDAALAESLPVLFYGGQVVLAPKEVLMDMELVEKLIESNQVNLVIMTPSVLRMLNPEKCPSIKTVLSVGEACLPDLPVLWNGNRNFFNCYGPTETSIGATWSHITDRERNQVNVTIGKPINNVKVYILDDNLHPVPIGIPGEIYIGGIGVGAGYINRPRLNAERFIKDPFSKKPDARLYKTGDLARFRETGNIEFLGRADFQVKLRGLRIEMGEIEARICEITGIDQSVVVMHEDALGEKRLVAYVVAQGQQSLDHRQLKRALSETLPVYMVPSVFIQLDAFPKNRSGKINRHLLPDPAGELITEIDGDVQSPRSFIEQGLVEICQDLLDAQNISVKDNFFEKGGHSLLATRLASRIRKVYKIELPLNKVFENPVLFNLAREIQTMISGESYFEEDDILPVSRENHLPLSFSQQRLWFLEQLSPGNLFYNIPTAIKIFGHPDLEILAQAFEMVINRHEVLRTTFSSQDGVPIQIIHDHLDFELLYDDLSMVSAQEAEDIIQDVIRKEAQTCFDMEQGPLFRVRLLKENAGTYIAMLTMHHIITDGWSIEILIKELAVLYETLATGTEAALPRLPVQYADYSVWQRDWLETNVLTRQLAYWKEHLGKGDHILDLPTDFPRPAVLSQNGAEISFELPRGLLKQLKRMAQKQGVTLYMVLLAAFQTLLYRYSGQEQINIGTAVANRRREELEDLIGFFVNTLIMRADFSEEPSFEDFLDQVRENSIAAYANQDLPFEMLVEEIQPKRDLSHTPLFQVAFSYQNQSPHQIGFTNLQWEPLEVFSGTSKFDLTLTINDGGEVFSGVFEYSTDLFKASTIQRMVGQYEHLLNEIVQNAKRKVSRLPLLPQQEERLLLKEWNEMARMPTLAVNPVELFELWVQKQPKHPALILGDQRMTYEELNYQSNQLARFLVKMGVCPEVFVGISFERRMEMIVAILGILKAGGAYLPLDPTYPKERLEFMVRDSRLPILITQTSLEPLFETFDIRKINLDKDWPQISREPGIKPDIKIAMDNLAYVIYTSGSTGKPKGTLLHHRGLSNLAQAQRKLFGIDQQSRILQFAPLSFDASVWEMFMALSNGGTLVLAAQNQLASPVELVEVIKRQRVTNITLPPSMLKVMPDEELPELRTIISAGEACPVELVQRWSVGRAFFNAYGPTETTVCASAYLCDPEDTVSPPIGKPIANTELFILDDYLQPVPIGVPGELHVGGVGLARGYLNRPEMTDQRFIDHPFGDFGESLYKTGDLVRYREDGNIDFLGRIDHQVKVNGFRIELGEIEAALRQNSQVMDVVVVTREVGQGQNALAAFIVWQDGQDTAVGHLRQYLRQTLPEYMIPSYFMFLESLPLLPNGKVDRKLLPTLTGERPQMEQTYVPPATETEKLITKICSELLGIDQIGIEDNFFDMGGHSLLATRLLSRLQEALGVEIPLRKLFECSTIAILAAEIDHQINQSQDDEALIDALLESLDEMSSEEIEQELKHRELI
jgi:amino acid adenylation domain-containing protein